MNLLVVFRANNKGIKPIHAKGERGIPTILFNDIPIRIPLIMLYVIFLFSFN